MISAVVRFHLDESVPNAIAFGLRKRKRDVTTTGDARLRSASDERQLAYATEAGRVLVTRDSDFVSMAASGLSHGGVVF